MGKQHAGGSEGPARNDPIQAARITSAAKEMGRAIVRSGDGRGTAGGSGQPGADEFAAPVFVVGLGIESGQILVFIAVWSNGNGWHAC